MTDFNLISEQCRMCMFLEGTTTQRFFETVNLLSVALEFIYNDGELHTDIPRVTCF